MKHKTKLSIIVAISFLVVVGLVFYLSVKKERDFQVSTQDIQVPIEQAGKVEQSSKLEGGTYQETQPNIKTVVVPGKVTSSTLNSIDIVNGGMKNSFSLDEKVLIISIKGGKSENIKITDIKKDDTVSIVINSANSQVVGIQIEE